MRYGDPSREEWTKLCQNHPQKYVQEILKIGADRARRLSEEYGVAPYQYCERHKRNGHPTGLLPREKFRTLKNRMCMECDLGNSNDNQPDRNAEAWQFVIDAKALSCWIATEEGQPNKPYARYAA